MNLSSPEVTEGLLYYGLITQEQADEANRRWVEQWDIEMEDFNWWRGLSDIVWSMQPWYRRFFGMSITWRYRWIKERRGW